MKFNLHCHQSRHVFIVVAVGFFLNMRPLYGVPSDGISTVGGFEIGNGKVVNPVGGYRFILPEKWEAGHSGTLTQVIAPIIVGIPRPQIQIDIIKTKGTTGFAESENEGIGQWTKATIGKLDGMMRFTKTENGLLRSEFRLKKSDADYYLISVDYGVASNDVALFELLGKAIESFQSTDH